MTAVAEEDIAAEFQAALAKDAGAEAPAAETVIAAPPRKADPAEQPARPAPKPRPSKAAKADDKARVAPVAEVAPLPAGKYAEGLTAFGEQVWLVASMNKGIAFGKKKTKDGVKPLVSVPDTRPYAAVFRQHLPVLARTWGEAARQNPTVRKYVGKVAGEGGGSWMLGVAFSSAMFAMGCATIAREENAELRARLAAENDQAVGEYMQQLAEALGLTEGAQE